MTRILGDGWLGEVEVPRLLGACRDIAGALPTPVAPERHGGLVALRRGSIRAVMRAGPHGPDYMLGWSGATVGEFYVELQATMPYENPGGLKDDDYADVIAYLFAINGVEPGEEELPSDPGQLEEISIDGPFTWNGRER